jgi:hypothetical protein
LTFAAAVVGVAATVGCGSAANGRAPEPRPILTAPARATMTPEVAEAETWVSSPGNSVYPAVVGAALGVSGDILPTPAQPNDASPQPLPPVPTAMVAAQERSSVVEQRTPNAPVGGSNPSVPANVEQWRGLVESIFPAFAVETVLRIMRCESGGNPNATGSAGERGLMQTMPRFHQAKADALFGVGADLYDPVVNLTVAAVISGNGSNWSAWTCK